MGFLNRTVIALSFSQSTLHAVKAVHGIRASRLVENAHWSLTESPLDLAGAHHDRFAESLTGAAETLGSGGGMLRIVIPAPLAQTTVVDSAVPPRSRREAEAMIGSRIAAVVGRERSQRIEVAYATNRTVETRLVGIGVDAALCEAAESAAAAAGLALTLLSISSTFRWDTLSRKARHVPGFLLEVMEDYWSLIAWDETGPYLLKSKWRCLSSAQGGEADEVSGEVLRLLTTRVTDLECGSFGTGHLLAPAEEQEPFRTALEGTLGTPIAESGDGLFSKSGRRADGAPSAALAAEVACVR